MSTVAGRRSFMRAAVGAATIAWSHRAIASGEAPPVTAVALAPGGDRVLAGSQAGVTVHDAVSLQPIATIPTGMDQVHDLQFAPDGRTLAVVGGNPSESGIVEWHSWPTAKLRTRTVFGDDCFYSLAFSPQGDRWVFACLDESCGVASVEADRPEVRYDQHSGPVLACCFLPSSEFAVSAGRDQTLRVWNTATGKTERVMHNHTDDVLAISLRPGREGLPMLASASADRTVRFWQPTIGRMVRFARLESSPLAITWEDDGGRLWVGCENGSVVQIDADSVRVTHTARPQNGWAYAVAWDAARRRVIAGGAEGSLRAVQLALTAEEH